MKWFFTFTYLSLFSTLAFSQPESAIYFARAEVKLLGGDTLGAIAEYKQIVPLPYRSWEEYNSKGYIQYLKNDFLGAIENYDDAIAANASYQIAYYNRGLAKEKLGRKKEALEDYTQAIELASNYQQAYVQRAGIYAEYGLFRHAINDLLVAIGLDSHPVQSLLKQSNHHHLHFKASIKDSIRVVKSLPSDTDFLRGIAAYHLKKYPAAFENLAKTIQLNPEKAEALEVLKEAVESYITQPQAN